MKRIGSLTLAALLGVAAWYAGPGFRATQQQAFAQVMQRVSDGGGVYLLSYYDTSTAFGKSEGGYGGAGHSGGAGDALLRIVNSGNFGVLAPAMDDTLAALPPLPDGALSGDVCANIYVFNDVQEMQECCQCDLSANSLRTLSVISDLTSNPLISKESTEAGVIKILGVVPASQGPPSVCKNSATVPFPLAHGIHAWINHTESMASNQATATPPFGFVTSTSVEEFQFARLDAGEFEQLFTECQFINLHGSGHGICTCGFGD